MQDFSHQQYHMDSNGQVIGSSYVETPAMSQSHMVTSPCGSVLIHCHPSVCSLKIGLPQRTKKEKTFIFQPPLVGGWTNPFWKIWTSNWIISPGIGVKIKKCLKPPPSPWFSGLFCYSFYSILLVVRRVDALLCWPVDLQRLDKTSRKNAEIFP